MQFKFLRKLFVFQVGEIISRFEKKGFSLKGTTFFYCSSYNINCDCYGLALVCAMKIYIYIYIYKATEILVSHVTTYVYEWHFF